MILCGKMRGLRRCIRLALAGSAAGNLLAVLFCLATVSFLLDRALRLSQMQRAFVSVGFAALFVWQAARELLPLARRLPEAEVALEVERRWRGPADLLASAMAFAGSQRLSTSSGSRRMRAQVIDRAEEAAQGIVPAEFVNWRRVRRPLAIGALCLTVALVLCAVQPGAAGLWARRNLLLADVDWPRKTKLTLLGFDGRSLAVPRGEEVEIGVRAAGAVPRMARLRLSFLDARRSRQIVMDRLGPNTFVARLPGLTSSCSFTVAAGDGFVPEHLLEVVERPRVVSAHVRIRPPDYLARPAMELAWNAPELKVPRGSAADVALTASKEISAASIAVNGGTPFDMQLAGSRIAQCSLEVEADLDCAVMITDGAGIAMAEPLRLALDCVEDAAPRVTLEAEGVGERVTPSARIRLRAVAQDDYGMDRAWIEAVHETGGESQAIGTWDLLGADELLESLGAEYVLSLDGLGLPAGGRVVCTAFARDLCDVPAAGVGRSDPIALRLVTVRELLAGLLIRQQDVRQDIEQQIDRQKGLRQQTWEAFQAAEQSGQAWTARAAQQRSLAPVLASSAESYNQILSEMLNNGIVKPPVFAEHAAGIVSPLALVSSPEGAAQQAAEALVRADSERALPAMRDVLRTLESVRTRMMLLETYTQVVAVVEEIAQRQEAVLERTRARWEELLRTILGPEE